ncbi:hypothetical protein STENM223S_04748 [Streptomyces tendae]
MGEAYWTTPSASRRIRPSPTRGEASISSCWFANGKVPAAIIWARSEALWRYVSSSRLGVRTVSRLVLRAITPSTRPSRRTGMDSTRTGTSSRHSGSPSRTIRPSSRAASSSGPAAARDQMADHVVLVGGGAGVGPHLGDGDVAGAVAGGDPQDEVGEGEVGEQLPLRDQQVEPLEVGVVECGVLAYEFVHGGHGCERTRGYVSGVKPPCSPETLPETPAGRGAWEGPCNPPGTAARSDIGRGVCGPGRPKDEDPGQSGQRAPVPRSAFLCGEDGSAVQLWTRPLGVSMRWSLFVVGAFPHGSQLVGRPNIHHAA